MKIKKHLSTGVLLIITSIAFAQVNKAKSLQVGNTSTNSMNPSAALQIDDTARGFLGARMTTAQRTAIASPARGLQVYDTDTNSMWLYNGTAWADSAASATSWSKTGNSGTNSATDFIGTTDNQALKLKSNNNTVLSILPDKGVVLGQDLSSLDVNSALGNFKIQDLSSSYGNKYMAPYGYRNHVNMVYITDDKPTGHNTDETLYVGGGTLPANTNNYGGFRNVDNQFKLSGTGTVGDLTAYHSELTNAASAVGTMTGMKLWLSTNASATTTNLYGLDIRDWSAAGNTTNKYGIYLGNMSAGTTSTYSIYSAGNYASYFEGNMGLGKNTPTEKLDVQGNVRFSGALMPNNTAGTAGQVLTSAGAGATPTWQTITIPTISGTAPINVTSGVVSLNDAGVSTSKLANNSVTIAKLPSGATATTFLQGDGTWTNQIANNTPSSAISASGTQVGIASTNVQGAISDLATAIKTAGNSTIYNSDGTITGNRTINQGSNSLSFTSSATTGTSHFSVDGTTLNVDAVNNRIGIGNIAPTEKLEVTGNIKADRLLAYGAGGLSSNVAIGQLSLNSNTTGTHNIAIGYLALSTITTGSFNSAIGSFTLASNSGSSNLANGYAASQSNTTGSANVAMGYAAIRNNTTGSSNVAIGYTAGTTAVDSSSITSLSNSVLIGNQTRPLANGQSNQIVIGDNANGIGTNSVVLGNDSITTTALKGKVGVGTTTPTVKLEVAGAIKVGSETITTPTAGMIRFNSTSNTFEGYNGTAWVTF